jgi:transposase
MPQALSFDLRSRVLAAIDEGLSCRQAAARFGVSASSAIRWQGMRRATALGRLIDVFTPTECTNYFAAAGYDAT